MAGRVFKDARERALHVVGLCAMGSRSPALSAALAWVSEELEGPAKWQTVRAYVGITRESVWAARKHGRLAAS